MDYNPTSFLQQKFMRKSYFKKLYDSVSKTFPESRPSKNDLKRLITFSVSKEKDSNKIPGLENLFTNIKQDFNNMGVNTFSHTISSRPNQKIEIIDLRGYERYAIKIRANITSTNVDYIISLD